jgi:hypothetical protein
MSVFLQPLQTVTVGSGGASSVTFSSIPQTYTDLKIVASMRDTGAGPHTVLAFNGSGSNFSNTILFGDGGSTYSQRRTDAIFTFTNDGTSESSNVFANFEMYLPNYASSNYKSFTLESVVENNGTTAYQSLYAGLWSNTSAVTSIGFTAGSTAFAQYSKFSLYGVLRQGI